MSFELSRSRNFLSGGLREAALGGIGVGCGTCKAEGLWRALRNSDFSEHLGSLKFEAAFIVMRD